MGKLPYYHHLTLKEAARQLGVCDMTVKKLIEEGRLAAHQIKQSIRISQEAIDNFIKSDSQTQSS